VSSTVTEHDDDAVLPRYGYRQQFVRSLRHFESFAVAFSFISITTGIFTTFAFTLSTGGPRGIWVWPIVTVGQTLVALVYGALAARVPLSGYSYQWASRLANVHVGWWLGWMSFAFLTIVTVSVDYGLVQVAFQPLIGETYTPTSAALETLVVLVLQAALIIWSTRITTRVNNTAVATELIGILGLTVLLIVVAAIRGLGHWSNLTSTGIVPSAGYWTWLGPFMLATLLGAYTIVGFESASNLAEETQQPHRVIPKAMVRAVLASGAVGMAFLIALDYAISNIPAASKSSAPVAFIVNDVLGSVVQKIFLIFVCVSIFACGLIIMVTNSRLIWSMSRDRRLPGYQLWRQVPRATGGPSWATVLAAVLGAGITLVLINHTSALVTLFTASTIMPALLYASTVLLYVFTGRRRSGQAGFFSLGRWEIPVIAGALIWLAYELIILIAPSEFRDAQYYVLGALGVGLIFYIGQWLLEPAAMRTETGAHGADALEAVGQPGPVSTPGAGPEDGGTS
jgi:amino acid transporter